MSAKLLCIISSNNRAFAEILSDSLLIYGDLDIASWESLPDISGYALILLDAGVLADISQPDSLAGLVEFLLSKDENAKIIVTTSSATWKRTREALLAGAKDYIRQSLEPESLKNSFYPSLDKYLPRLNG